MIYHLCFLFEDPLLFFILSQQTKEQLRSPPAPKRIGGDSVGMLEPNATFAGTYQAILKMQGMLLKLTPNRSES